MPQSTLAPLSAGLGGVFWITGLPGAGKTSVGRHLWRRLKREGYCTAFLDGDRLRAILDQGIGGQGIGFAPTERMALARIYASLCLELSSQGIEVVCATVSMFEEIRKWNRVNIPRYREVYIRASPQVLMMRDQKGLYTGAVSGTAHDVLGYDQPFDEPRSPDIVIDNDGATSAEAIADRLHQLARGGENSGPKALNSAVMAAPRRMTARRVS